MRRIIVLLALILPVWVVAQERGIQFGKFRNWQEVIKEAERTQKIIFVDAYTTWCGPCKRMDKEVYTNDAVGAYANKYFISLKIQFDQTSKDDDFVRGWHNDVKYLEEKFDVSAYPTALFISPEGGIVDKAVGFMNADQFTTVLKNANDPKHSFAGKIEQFQQGDLVTDSLLTLSLRAKELRQDSIAGVIAKSYKTKVIDHTKPENILSPKLFEFVAKFPELFSDADPLAVYMYKYPRDADRAMETNYSTTFVQYLILRDYINSEIVVDNKYVSKTPPWNKLQKRIAKKFDPVIAKKTMLITKAAYYNFHKDWHNAIKYAIQKNDYLGIDTSLLGLVSLNNFVYEVIFRHSNDKAQIQKGISYMETLINREKENYFWIDTYANLLYKAGKKQKAMEQQEIAIDLARSKNDHGQIKELAEKLALMQNDQPIWNMK